MKPRRLSSFTHWLAVLAWAFASVCCAAQQPFYVKPYAWMCPHPGILINTPLKDMGRSGCFGLPSKPLRVVVLDIDPKAPLAFVCRHEAAGAEKAMLSWVFSCGYAFTNSLVDETGGAVSLPSLRAAAKVATMVDVRQMPHPVFGCLVDDTIKNC
jgi:hypothetical protein